MPTVGLHAPGFTNSDPLSALVLGSEGPLLAPTLTSLMAGDKEGGRLSQRQNPDEELEVRLGSSARNQKVVMEQSCLSPSKGAGVVLWACRTLPGCREGEGPGGCPSPDPRDSDWDAGGLRSSREGVGLSSQGSKQLAPPLAWGAGPQGGVHLIGCWPRCLNGTL